MVLHFYTLWTDFAFADNLQLPTGNLVEVNTLAEHNLAQQHILQCNQGLRTQHTVETPERLKK